MRASLLLCIYMCGLFFMILSYPFLAFAVYSAVCLIDPKLCLFQKTCAAYPENLLYFIYLLCSLYLV
jgi:hypothetical protein